MKLGELSNDRPHFMTQHIAEINETCNRNVLPQVWEELKDRSGQHTSGSLLTSFAHILLTLYHSTPARRSCMQNSRLSTFLFDELSEALNTVDDGAKTCRISGACFAVRWISLSTDDIVARQ